MENLKCGSLMIGDWVKLSKGNWSKIVQVGLTDIEMIAESVYLAEPIPLTPEILEKNGFHYNNPDDLPIWDGWEQYGLLLYQSGKGYAINCGTNVAMEINAVNDLQHALKICGIEKEITL